MKDNIALIALVIAFCAGLVVMLALPEEIAMGLCVLAVVVSTGAVALMFAGWLLYGLCEAVFTTDIRRVE